MSKEKKEKVDLNMKCGDFGIFLIIAGIAIYPFLNSWVKWTLLSPGTFFLLFSGLLFLIFRKRIMFLLFGILLIFIGLIITIMSISKGLRGFFLSFSDVSLIGGALVIGFGLIEINRFKKLKGSI